MGEQVDGTIVEGNVAIANNILHPISRDLSYLNMWKVTYMILIIAFIKLAETQWGLL